LLAALAWAVTVTQAKGMGVGPGTMGLSLAAFLALWVVMMTAMMFPSVAPMVVMWIDRFARPTRSARVTGVAGFLCGYLVAWAAFGLLAYVG
jgi:predicted metal-binding membrane protein